MNYTVNQLLNEMIYDRMKCMYNNRNTQHVTFSFRPLRWLFIITSTYFPFRPIVHDFELKNRIGLKSVEKSTQFREEGNRLFQVTKHWLGAFINDVTQPGLTGGSVAWWHDLNHYRLISTLRRTFIMTSCN